MNLPKQHPQQASAIIGPPASIVPFDSAQPHTITKVDLDMNPSDHWVFRTLAMGGWDFEANPILIVTTLEMVKDENTGALIGSNVIFDFVDPRKPSQRVAVMTKSLIEVFEQIKAAYTMEMLGSDGKARH